MRNIGPYPATHISELNPDCIETYYVPKMR